MKILDINFRDILFDEKKYENIVIYDISYRIFMGSIPLCIMFDEIDGFIKIYDGIRYLVLLYGGFYDEIHDRINYLIIFRSTVIMTQNKFIKIKFGTRFYDGLRSHLTKIDRGEFFYHIFKL